MTPSDLVIADGAIGRGLKAVDRLQAGERDGLGLLSPRNGHDVGQPILAVYRQDDQLLGAIEHTHALACCGDEHVEFSLALRITSKVPEAAGLAREQVTV